MAQARQQSNAMRSRYAQLSFVQSGGLGTVRATCEQLEQLNRKLSAAHAEIQRYQTRLFACERQLIALRKENSDLEAACEQAREEARQAAAEVEMLRAQLEEQETTLQNEVLDAVQSPQPETQAVPQTHPEEQAVQTAAVPEKAAAPVEPAPAPVQKAAEQSSAEPEWKPKTELDHLSVELMKWFDDMMGA